MNYLFGGSDPVTGAAVHESCPPALTVIRPESIIHKNRSLSHIDDYVGAMPCLYCRDEKGKPGLRALPTSMTLVMFPPHVLGPKYERWQRPRNSQGFRIGKSLGNLAMTPDVAGVISLNGFLAPVDDNVTAISIVTKSQSYGKRSFSVTTPCARPTRVNTKRLAERETLLHS